MEQWNQWSTLPPGCDIPAPKVGYGSDAGMLSDGIWIADLPAECVDRAPGGIGRAVSDGLAVTANGRDPVATEVGLCQQFICGLRKKPAQVLLPGLLRSMICCRRSGAMAWLWLASRVQVSDRSTSAASTLSMLVPDIRPI